MWTPPDIRASWPYEDPGPWTGPASCSGGPTPGVRALRAYLEANFRVTTGGYDCRPNTANTNVVSVHGTGRAIDVFIHGDMVEGTRVADWLVRHAEEIGVPVVIWDHVIWNAQRGARPYTGPVPHTDHVHVELATRAANLQTAWFTQGGATVPPEGDGAVASSGTTSTVAAGLGVLALAAGAVLVWRVLR